MRSSRLRQPRAGTDTLPQRLPFREFILKLHSRCNLACDYCYIYEMADQSWRGRPQTMSPETVGQSARRIAEHAHHHRLDRVDVVFHGGEPLLAGVDLIGKAARTLRHAAEGVEVSLSVQTNGLLLDDRMVGVLAEHGVRIGISLDGGRVANDRHRRFRNGRGSYEAIAANIGRLTGGPHRDLFAGLLCTVDLANDPVETYENLLGFAPPTVDFLLPHGNWTEPPPAPPVAGSPTPYGDWLVAVFDRWYGAPRQEVRIRMFREIMQLLLGRPSRSELIGLSPVRMIVIETDGSLEQVDSLKSTFDGAAATGYDVFTHSLDAARPSSHHRAPARHGRAERHVPALPGRDGLWRWLLSAPLPSRRRVPQPVRVLPRPTAHHHAHPVPDGG